MDSVAHILRIVLLPIASQKAEAEIMSLHTSVGNRIGTNAATILNSIPPAAHTEMIDATLAAGVFNSEWT